MRVLAAMSGGVDSAVAAARAVDLGHEVVGVHLALSRVPAAGRTGSRGCCTVEDADDARRAADLIGIPFYVWDFAERFEAEVVDDFVAGYAAGRTPNPCVRCNERIKFAALLDKALALGFDAVCTGHYARLLPGPDGAPRLHRAADRAKDQSYVLAVLPPERIARVLLPLGDTEKPEVRRDASRRRLPVAAKPDSHDICFIPDGDTAGWLAGRLEPRPGPIVDAEGRQLGEHAGTHGFTVGQRRGLRLGRPAPDGRPRYVLAVRPESATVVVGPRDELRVAALRCGPPVWCASSPPAVGERVGVQVRAHGEEVPGTVASADDAGLHLELGRPLTGVAPGQTVALYRDDLVLGSARLESTEPWRHGSGPQDPPRP